MQKEIVLESCFNQLIANDFSKAQDLFSENYYKYPEIDEFFYGVVISSILHNDIDYIVSFLQKEVKLSSFSNRIKLVLSFIKKNSYLKNMENKARIFNLGLFLRKRGLSREAKIFFRVIQVLEPENIKALTILGEYSIKEGEIKKGMNLFAFAAKGFIQRQQ